MDTTNHIKLGKTDLTISSIGLGTMQWGDVLVPQNAGSRLDPVVQAIYQTSLEMGITFFDTAELYGSGRSERHLGMNLHGKSENLVIATKFMPFPWRLTKGELKTALIKSLTRLGLKRVELYQMHWPFPPLPIKAWMDAMADVVAEGLVQAVGVSNYSAQQTEMAQNTLAHHRIPLASNQVRYSLLDRRPEKGGLVEYCKRSGITIIAYSPLEKGILTGKFSPDNLPTGFRAWRYNRTFLMKIEPLMHELREIGIKHDGKSPGQVSLNWLVAKGAVPIPGARSVAQAKENAGAMGWMLTAEEVEKLDRASQTYL